MILFQKSMVKNLLLKTNNDSNNNKIKIIINKVT